MTRIYTNIPSLIANRSLQVNMSALQTSLERLSTGLRINSGKDDPSGLIASEMLRSDITGVKQGISNTQRANNMLAVADSALNEINKLLNEIRRLVTEAANDGAMSLEMIQADQYQIDASLDAIDRISATTSFMGKKLLDGSLDFVLEGVRRNDLQDLAVTQAQLGTQGQPIDVQVSVQEAAEQATLYYAHSVAAEDVTLSVGGLLGKAVQSFERGAKVEDIARWVNENSDVTGIMAVVQGGATTGSLITSSVGPNNDIIIRAGSPGEQAGFVEVKYSYGSDKGLVVQYEESSVTGCAAVINVFLQTAPWEQARAVHVDSTAGVHDNNSLEYIANIAGEKFNDVSIHYVDGNLTDERFADPTLNPSGISRGVNAVYHDSATAATAVLGDINGLTAFTGLNPGEYVKLTATKAGSAYNDIKIEFVNDSNRVNIPVGTNAFAKMETVSPTNAEKVLRIYVDTNSTTGPHTTFYDIQNAVKTEGTFTLGFSEGNPPNHDIGRNVFSLADTVNSGLLGATPVYGNTSKSGGEAKTIFISLNTEDVPEYMGLRLNEPLTSVDFTNFTSATEDTFLLTANEAGYNNTKLTFEPAGKNDAVFENITGNVAAVYSEEDKALRVYIRSKDDYAPPLYGAGIENVSFQEIANAIATAKGVKVDTFVVALGGAAAGKILDYEDLTYAKPAALPLVGIGASEEVTVRAYSGVKLSGVQFVAIAPQTGSPPVPDVRLGGGNAGGTYDPKTGLITVYLKNDGTTSYANIQAAIAATVNPTEPPTTPFLFDLGTVAGGTTFNLDNAIPEYTVPAFENGTLGTIGVSLLNGNTELTSKLPADVRVQFVAVPYTDRSHLLQGTSVAAEYSNCVPHTVTVYLRTAYQKNSSDPAVLEKVSFAELDSVLQAITVQTSTNPDTFENNYFRLNYSTPNALIDITDTGLISYAAYDGERVGATTTLAAVHSANDIKDAFDLDRSESRGNERAADLFTVYRSRDNDGTGAIWSMAAEKALTDGADGGAVVNTAQEVVAALNNSKYWGTTMTRSQLQSWYETGSLDSRTDPPLIISELAPGNHGLSTVSVFSEVAYFGSAVEGTGMQFLGPNGSNPIRFVIGGPDSTKNSPLSLDWTSIPDKVDYARAILTATNPNADIIIQSKQIGGAYDDVLFRFVRAEEDPNAVPPLVRESGWADYDYGTSYSEAQMIFGNSVNCAPIANTAFDITANDRGAETNNVSVLMRQSADQTERVAVSYDKVKGSLQISLRSNALSPLSAGGPITAREIIDAINKDANGDGISDCGFNAQLSYALESNNTGLGTFESIGLTSQYAKFGDTGSTGGRTGGTVTVYLIGEGNDHLGAPTTGQIVNIINSDDILGRLFSATNYTGGSLAGTGAIDFVKDTNIVSSGGLVEQGILVVHLATDANGLPITTARDLVAYWDTLSEEQSRGISASLVRDPGMIWDECNDEAGWGIIPKTPSEGDCDTVYYDTYFLGWTDCETEPLLYVPDYAVGTMTAINGENASFDLRARRTGDEYNGYSLVYAVDNTLTGSYDDNYYGIDGVWDQAGIRLTVDESTKKITIFIKEGVTTALDVEQLIETDPKTRSIFEVTQRGNGTGLVDLRDDTLLTKGGTLPPSVLNGAKLLFGRDESEYALEFLSEAYGSRAFVEVYAINGAFSVNDIYNQPVERSYGKDADVQINGVKAVADGLDVHLSTSALEMHFTLSEYVGSGYSTNFRIMGGGATFQLGPQVVSNQQTTIGIQSVNTVSLGGTSGRLYQLRDGLNASLTKGDLNLAYRIVEEAIVNITFMRGRLGSLQKLEFDTNIDVLSDTLEALATAESDIRDADFAVETSNLTRNQVLVQASSSALGIANQLPNYVLGLLQ